MNEIVVGYDGSETAEKAAAEAAQIAGCLGRPLHLVYAMPYPKAVSPEIGMPAYFHDDTVGEAKEMLAAAGTRLGGRMTITDAVVDGDPAKVLVAEAKRLGASMIVVGNRRVQGLGRVLGSVAVDVAHRAPCSVLIVHTV